MTKEILDRLRAEMQAVRSPQSDVHPCLFEVHESGRITRQKIPWALFNGRARKDALTALMVRCVMAHKPQVFAWSSTMYMRRLDGSKLTPEQHAQWQRNEWPEGEKRPLDPTAEDRVEQVHVLVFHRDGTITGHASEITRDGRNPPVFGEWQDGRLTDGLMVAPLRKAMMALSR